MAVSLNLKSVSRTVPTALFQAFGEFSGFLVAEADSG